MRYDWLPIDLPQRLAIAEPVVPGIEASELELSRDQDLNLRVTFEGDGHPMNEEAPVPGTQWKGSSIALRTTTGQAALLEGFHRTNIQTSTEGGRKVAKVSGGALSLTVTFADAEPSTVLEWIANIPSLVWPGMTKRSKATVLTRVRNGEEAKDEFNEFSSTWDHFTLELGLPTVSSIRVGCSPSEVTAEGVVVDRAGVIEYRRGPDGPPADGLRHAVKRALEFLFGAGLGVLGRSDLSTSGDLIRTVRTVPHIAGGVGTRLPPALLHEEYRDGIDEVLAASIVRRYITFQEPLQLNRVVWLYLHGRSAALDMKSGYIGGAFELLCRRYYEQPENERKSRLFTKPQWSEVSKEFRALVDSLSEREIFKDSKGELERIRERLGEFNRISMTRLKMLFLDDLGLSFGEAEEQALKARNDAAHANDVDGDYFETLRAYRASHTLLARAVLKSLGVSIRYFDYSSNGYPDRELEEAQRS